MERALRVIAQYEDHPIWWDSRDDAASSMTRLASMALNPLEGDDCDELLAEEENAIKDNLS